MVNINNEKLDEEMKRYWDIFLKGNEPRFKEPHITVLHFKINDVAVMSKHFEAIKRVATDKFNKHVENIEIHIKNKAKLLGRPTGNKFLTLDCDVDEDTAKLIENFRRETLEGLKDVFDAKSMSIDKLDEGWYSVSYDGKALITLPSYSWEISKWTPHVSILSLFDIRSANRELFDKFEIKDNTPNIKHIMDVLEKYYYEHTKIEPKSIDVEGSNVKFNCLS